MRPLGANMLSTVLSNALAAWLLTEWLWPLEAVTDTAHIGVFVSFVALCFGLHLLRVPIWLSALGKMVYIWWALSRLFSFASIAALPHALWRDSTVWLSGDWSSMPGDALRTFVFFCCYGPFRSCCIGLLYGGIGGLSHTR